MTLKKTSFTENLVRINGLSFNKWVFEPGMLFMSRLKWWGDKGERGEPHNGLDLLSYEAHDAARKMLYADTKIPIIYRGRIVKQVKDFLGYSLFAAHEIHDGKSRLFTIYGHVLPAPDILIGEQIDEGTVIASLAKTSGAKVPGHLHISAALIPNTISIEDLSWKTLNDPDKIRFLDPEIII